MGVALNIASTSALLCSLISILLGISLPARAQTSALRFVALTPCRVVDTRLPDGPFGGPPLQGQESRDFNIPNGPCEIPNTAAAYWVNVTVVPQGPLGYLTAWPAGRQQPSVFTLTSPDSRVKAQAAIVPAGSGGAISVFAANTTDVVLDVNGYFVSTNDPSALEFFPLPPCRIVDTRMGQGGTTLQGMTAYDYGIQNICDVPSNAQAYSLNFTLVPVSKVPVGYLTVWPQGQPQPNASTLDDYTATVVANAAIVPAGGKGGEISAWAYTVGQTDLIVDIDGYFAPAGQGGLSLHPVSPCRAFDTRDIGNGQPFSGTLNPPADIVDSGCGVPSIAQAYVLNATVVPSGPLGYLTLWPDGEGQPGVSTLNAADGAITSNMAIVSTANGWIDAFAFNPTQLTLDIFSYFAPIGLSITTTSLPSGVLNSSYNASLQATGGLPPYAWSLTAGNLPPGLSLNSTGLISGTPTASGTWGFTTQVSDSESPPATASAPLSITVQSSLSITTNSLPSGTVNNPYSATLAATGGLPPYTWSVIQGSLPAGLTLDANSGVISRTPTAPGTFNFTMQVSDSESPPATASAPLSITVSVHSVFLSCECQRISGRYWLQRISLDGFERAVRQA